jgi:hypothetical protein
VYSSGVHTFRNALFITACEEPSALLQNGLLFTSRVAQSQNYSFRVFHWTCNNNNLLREGRLSTGPCVPPFITGYRRIFVSISYVEYHRSAFLRGVFYGTPMHLFSEGKSGICNVLIQVLSLPPASHTRACRWKGITSLCFLVMVTGNTRNWFDGRAVPGHLLCVRACVRHTSLCVFVLPPCLQVQRRVWPS